jgi:hypothetical protein
VEPPPYEYRQGITPDERGGVTIWFRTRARAGVPDAGKPAKVWLRYREEGATEFQSVELAWDETNFRFFAGLEANPERKRTAYYFVAASTAGVERAYPLPAPGLTYFLPVIAGVKINEVLPRPAREAGGSGEFIEIYNPSGSAVSLEGCFLSDTRRNTTRWRIPEGNTIPPRGFLVFYADGLNRENHTSFRLSNSGEFLGLYGRMEEGNLLLDSMAYRGMRMGESWGALPDGSRNFRVWKAPTPGAKNLPRIPEDRLGKEPQPEGEGSGEPAAPIDDSGQGWLPPGASGGDVKPPLDPQEDLPEDP